MDSNKLSQMKCVACEGDIQPLSKDQAEKWLKEIPEWKLNNDATEISREFHFKNFFRTMSFANAVAWISNNENHHPDMEIGFDRCKIRYQTHAIHGLSNNDFICAAKVNLLVNSDISSA